MSTRERMAYGLILTGVIAGLGNYPWLVGLVPQPPYDLMTARWVYEVTSFTAAGLIGWGPR